MEQQNSKLYSSKSESSKQQEAMSTEIVVYCKLFHLNSSLSLFQVIVSNQARIKRHEPKTFNHNFCHLKMP